MLAPQPSPGQVVLRYILFSKVALVGYSVGDIELINSNSNQQMKLDLELGKKNLQEADLEVNWNLRKLKLIQCSHIYYSHKVQNRDTFTNLCIM